MSTYQTAAAPSEYQATFNEKSIIGQGLQCCSRASCTALAFPAGPMRQAEMMWRRVSGGASTAIAKPATIPVALIASPHVTPSLPGSIGWLRGVAHKARRAVSSVSQ
jgi:hypothetical protein